MSRSVKRIAELRRKRDLARAAFDGQLSLVNGDLEQRSVGGRIVDKIGEEAREGLTHAIEVANENRPVVAGTMAALLVWALRNPIVHWIGNRFADDDTDQDESEYDE